MSFAYFTSVLAVFGVSLALNARNPPTWSVPTAAKPFVLLHTVYASHKLIPIQRPTYKATHAGAKPVSHAHLPVGTHVQDLSGVSL